jgi:D-alanyl-D-alanine carboxypeptidase
VEGGHLRAEDATTPPVPWWSVRKTVLGAGALARVAEGRLWLDAPLAGPAFALRQLLQHTAGVPNYGGLASYHGAVARGDEPLSEAEGSA